MIYQSIDIQKNNNHFSLLQEKAVYWHNISSLLIADVHAGKANLFRQHGIPISSDLLIKDLTVIEDTIKRLNARSIHFLGDLFHSTHNEENEFVLNWIDNLNIDVILISGNHDIHSADNHGFEKLESLTINNITLSHYPSKDANGFTISGHIHPSFVLNGRGRQRIKLPCFYLNQNNLILPAFGSLTGNKAIRKHKGDSVFMVSERGLIPA